jgi:N-acetylmuramic acid 6-phosphate (MurNAc-6-P) etherase
VARDEQLRVKVDVTGDRDLDKLATKVDQAGDAFDDAAKQADRLDRETKDLNKSIKELQRTYNDGGDAEVKRQIEGQLRELQKIERLKRQLAKLDDDAVKRAGNLKKLTEDQVQAAARKRAGIADPGGGFLATLLGTGGGGKIGQTAGMISGAAGSLTDTGIIGDSIKAYVLSMLAPLIPAAGAGVGGAIGAGAAFGGVAAGTLGAFKGPDGDELEGRYTAILDRLEKRWIGASRSFTQPLRNVADELSRVADDFPLEKALQLSAGYAERLGEGLAGLAGNTGGGLVNLLSKVEPIVAELAEELPELGEDFASMFDSIGDGADGGADAIGDILDVIGIGVRLVGGWIEAFEKLYGVIHDSFAGDALRWLAQAFDGEKPKSFAKEIQPATQATDDYAEAQKRAAEATAEQNRQITDQISQLLALSNANIGYERAVDDLTESFKENGRNIDITTEKGRQNVEQINEVIAWIQRQRDEAIAAGKGSAEATAAANRAYEGSIEKLRAQLRQLGLTEAQINSLIAAYGRIPKQIHTTIFTHYEVDGAVPHGSGRGSGSRFQLPSAYAEGTMSAAAGLAIVGEKGPELVEMRGGERVYTAAETQRMLGSPTPLGVAGHARMDVQLPPTSVIEQALVAVLMKMLNSGQMQIPSAAVR